MKPVRTRKNWALMLAIGMLAACSSSSSREPPRNQENVCAIFDERPGWRDAALASQIRWGAPISLQMAIIRQESSFRGEARPPKRYFLGIIPNGRLSSAYGYAQAIDGTWEWYQRESGNSDADRSEFADAIDFVGWYVSKSTSSNGIARSDAYNHYLAYHEGHAGHRRASYNGKPWLKSVARKVAEQSRRYDAQLSRCS